MSPDEIKHRLIASSGTSWDAQVVGNATYDDLDTKAISKYISLVKATGRRPLGKEKTSEVLEKLELVQKGRPTRAAILLLGKKPGKFFLSALVQVGRFKSPTRIIDTKRLEGNRICRERPINESPIGSMDSQLAHDGLFVSPFAQIKHHLSTVRCMPVCFTTSAPLQA